jgi:hypothetical protein
MIPRNTARGGVYEIRVEGQLDAHWQDWFEGMTLTSLPAEGQALLRGAVRDQAALHGLLARIRDLNLVLVLVRRVN